MGSDVHAATPISLLSLWYCPRLNPLFQHTHIFCNIFTVNVRTNTIRCAASYAFQYHSRKEPLHIQIKEYYFLPEWARTQCLLLPRISRKKCCVGIFEMHEKSLVFIQTKIVFWQSQRKYSLEKNAAEVEPQWKDFDLLYESAFLCGNRRWIEVWKNISGLN